MKRFAVVPLLILLPGACAAPQAGAPGMSAGAAAPADAFWAGMQQHCGRAYTGGLAVAPPGDEMLTGTEELIVHFRECGDETLKLPFHIELEETASWDRSRTWVFMRTEQGIELRHDHRHSDGTPEESTWYGAHTRDAGSAQRQEFILPDRRAADGSTLGWRVEIVPGERYTYGTIRGENWTWRVDFDLTREVDAPPAPWGHEATPAATPVG